MDWITDKVANAIWSFIYNLASDILNKAFSLITDMIMKFSDINAYFDISRYLIYIQAISGSLLVVAVAWEAFKQQSGNVLPGDEKSVSQLAGQTAVGGLSIFLLPWSVTHMFLPICNSLIVMIQKIGVKAEASDFTKYIDVKTGFANLGGTLIILTLILAVSFFLLGLAGGIRYLELLLVILIAPIVSISAVRNYDAINIWVRETTAIVFTQPIQIFLLQVLMQIMINIRGPIMYILCIACIVVMLRGPQVLRTFLYSTGTGGAAVGAAGSVGRIKAMQIMMKSIK